MIRTSGKDYQLPSYKFLNAILRKNRRYYNGENSNFVNLFYSDYSDDFTDPFTRIDLLRWLKENYSKEGPSKAKGMFPVRDIMRDMQIIGHDLNVSRRELNYLLKRGLVISESLSSIVSDDDLVKISIPGSLHLGLLNNVTYLAACAEDTNFKNSEVMSTISKRLASNSQLTKLSLALTTHDFIHYLLEYRKEYSASPESYLANATPVDLYDLGACINALDKWIEKDPYVKNYFSALQIYSSGAEIVAEVVSKSNGALVCVFGENCELKGFISALDSRYKLTYEQYDLLNVDSKLKCKILEFDLDHKSFQLEYLGTIEE